MTRFAVSINVYEQGIVVRIQYQMFNEKLVRSFSV